MPRVDWNNLTFSGKEIITVASFCFAISGLYYKTIITDQENKQKYELQQNADSKEMAQVLAELDRMRKDIRILQDNDLKRTTLESNQQESSKGYLPLNRK